MDLRGRVIVAAMALGACAKEEAEPSRYSGESFSFPVPDGFVVITDETNVPGLEPLVRDTGEMRRRDPRRGHVVLGARLDRDGFRPWMVLQRAFAPGGGPSETPVDCAALARGTAREIGEVESSSVIAGPTGPSCQIRIKTPEKVILLTELMGPNETWLMNCDFAPTDRASEQACQDLIASLRFTAR